MHVRYFLLSQVQVLPCTVDAFSLMLFLGQRIAWCIRTWWRSPILSALITQLHKHSPCGCCDQCLMLQGCTPIPVLAELGVAFFMQPCTQYKCKALHCCLEAGPKFAHAHLTAFIQSARYRFQPWPPSVAFLAQLPLLLFCIPCTALQRVYALV